MNLNKEGLIVLNKKVTLKPYVAKLKPQREYLTDAEIQTWINYPAFINIEVYPNYFCCSFKINGKFLTLECGQGRSFNNKFLSWLMQTYKTIGFNSIKYDLLIIWLAYYTQDVTTLKAASDDLILQGLRAQELKQKYNFFTFKTNTIDLIEVSPLKGSLKLYGARLHAKSIQDQPFPINQDLSEFEISELKHFNFNQLDITEKLFHFMKERLDLRENLGAEYREDLMSKSDAQIAEVILAKEIEKLNGKASKRQEIEPGTVYKYSIPPYVKFQSAELNAMLGKIRMAKFVVGATGKIAIPEELKSNVRIGGNGVYRLGIGGLHSSEECCSFKASNDIAIVDRDVASYYPRLITTLKLYPTSCGPNFLVAFEKIIEIRLDAKARKIFSRDKGLKIVINGTSGKLSDIWSLFYSPDNTIQMTVSGQLALLMFIEWLELAGIQVISANTDGIVMLLPKYLEAEYERIYRAWESTTGFTTEETRYKGYYARDVNSYFAIKEDGKIKKKGPYSEIGSQSGTQLDTNPTVMICSDAVEALLSKGTPIEETILAAKDFTRFITVRQAKAPGAHWKGEYLGKVIRWAYMKGETDCIRTVAHNSKVADSDGARPYMDMPDSFPDDINYSWYIAKAKEILVEIGYLQKPKQLVFF